MFGIIGAIFVIAGLIGLLAVRCYDKKNCVGNIQGFRDITSKREVCYGVWSMAATITGVAFILAELVFL